MPDTLHHSGAAHAVPRSCARRAFLNYFVLGDQVVSTPLFLGSKPVKATSGKYEGIEILQQEQNDSLGGTWRVEGFPQVFHFPPL